MSGFSFLSLEAKPWFRQEGTWLLGGGKEQDLQRNTVFLRYEAKEKVWSCLLESRGLACFTFDHAQGKTLLQSWKAQTVM